MHWDTSWYVLYKGGGHGRHGRHREFYPPVFLSALHHSWRPTDKPWVAKTGRGQRRIHGLRVSQPLAVWFVTLWSREIPAVRANEVRMTFCSWSELLSSPNNQVLQSQSVASYCLMLPPYNLVVPWRVWPLVWHCIYIPLSRRRRITFARN